MEMESCVPPGFRFHPTEEELVGYYLRRKINSMKIDLDVIIDIDLYRMEPWDIQDRCKLGYEEQNEWYFFSHKDRKYPTGTRTNRATTAGFWKATGRDKAVLSKDRIIGMRKTLVFYKGRAPNGRKTDWIMHEYRLQTSEHGPPQEEGWVVCRAFKKPIPSHKPAFGAWNINTCYHISNNSSYKPASYTCLDPNSQLNQDQNFNQPPLIQNQVINELPKLDSPTISTSFATNEEINEDDQKSNFGSDWKSFDNLLGFQLIGTSSNAYTNMPFIPHNDDQLLECFSDL
ncbi:hypothetical protein CDL12_16498 [Handroanthus impetiginosus]|uniref:NAC domain-containing protein n=1 Tax=Handroanthus impetiginosus TaxID=429701 RepID=A0A2G9H044_9LAMI|nr:hypothetical protein CDL12_16498 [Handroanthus impetiginosus]